MDDNNEVQALHARVLGLEYDLKEKSSANSRLKQKNEKEALAFSKLKTELHDDRVAWTNMQQDMDHKLQSQEEHIHFLHLAEGQHCQDLSRLSQENKQLEEKVEAQH
jgi:hypothetical protein